MNAFWLKYLPSFIRVKLDGRLNLQAAVGNSGWLFADKILRMAVGLFVGAWIARYLGPEQYGLWNFSIAFTALFGAFASLGLDGIVVRELVNNPERENELLGSAFILKFIGGVIAFVISIFAIMIVRRREILTLWLVMFSAAGFIFQSVNVIGLYFQSRVQSKYTVYAANGAFILMTIIKIILLLISAPLIAFAVVGLSEVATTAIFLLIAYRFNHHNIRAWRYDETIALNLLRDSWPLILSILAIMIYMRIDQIMIGQMLGDKQVGLFSAAVKISELWNIIPVAIVSSVFPLIINYKNKNENTYYKNLQKLFNLMSMYGVGVAIVMTFSSRAIVELLFGAAYAPTATVLMIHIWAGVFVALGIASETWLVAENLQKYSFYRTLNGSFANIALNVFLIPKYGIDGAAVATILSYGVSVFSIGLNVNCRVIFFMMCRSINPLKFGENKC